MDYYEKMRNEREQFKKELLKKAKTGEPVWAYAFEMGKSENGRRKSHYPPTKGILVLKGYDSYTSLYFRPLGKLKPKASEDRKYHFDNRLNIVFSDTEAQNEYEKLVKQRINELMYQIEELKSLI